MLHLASRCRSISRPLTAGSTTTTPSQLTIQPEPPGQPGAICSLTLTQFEACDNLLSTPTTPVLRQDYTLWVSSSTHPRNKRRSHIGGRLCGLSDNFPSPVAQNLITTTSFHQLRLNIPQARHARQQRRRRVRVFSHLAACSAAATRLLKRLRTPTFHQRVCHRPP